MNQYYVYILASQKNNVLYIGVTNNLIKRIYEHKNNLVDGFTSQYKVHKLVYFEESNDIQTTILREKRIKKWNRQWKERLIKKMNPNWKDLYENLVSNIDPRLKISGMTRVGKD
jgi:putative endonuclease